MYFWHSLYQALAKSCLEQQVLLNEWMEMKMSWLLSNFFFIHLMKLFLKSGSIYSKLNPQMHMKYETWHCVEKYNYNCMIQYNTNFYAINVFGLIHLWYFTFENKRWISYIINQNFSFNFLEFPHNFKESKRSETEVNKNEYLFVHPNNHIKPTKLLHSSFEVQKLICIVCFYRVLSSVSSLGAEMCA